MHCAHLLLIEVLFQSPDPNKVKEELQTLRSENERLKKELAVTKRRENTLLLQMNQKDKEIEELKVRMELLLKILFEFF